MRCACPVAENEAGPINDCRYGGCIRIRTTGVAVMSEDEPRGPRDWEPPDPDAPFWNPRPGDAYGPSDQEHRQPWEPSPSIRRFPGAAPLVYEVPPFPPEPRSLWTRLRAPKPWGALVRSLRNLALTTLGTAMVVAVFVAPLRGLMLHIGLGAVTVLAETTILDAMVTMADVWKRRRARLVTRIGAVLGMLAALVPAPLGFALLFQRWAVGFLTIAAGAVAATGIRIVASVRYRRSAPSRPTEPPEPYWLETYQQTVGAVALLVLMAGLCTSGLYLYHEW
jgi:hypothetical protein